MGHMIEYGRGSVGVWRAISQSWKSELVFMEGTRKRGITASDYLEQVLMPLIGPAFLGQKSYEVFPESQHVEDAAPWHGIKQVLIESKKELSILLHKRLTQSPNLNHIGNIWRIMNQQIKARDHFLGTVAERRWAVQEEWDWL
ncbi:hypothetical protein HOY80DRAFT_1005992 [Tuber brumale]|nr:hypothetical protein HOY80DRAFT_1005992 [Tuber brumale]